MMNRLMMFAVATILPFQITAAQPTDEPALMAYMQIPFGTKSQAQAAPTYGFRIERHRNSSSTDSLQLAAVSQQMPLLDFQYRTGQLPMVMLSGVNIIKYEYGNNAAAGAAVGASINWTMVAVGVGLTGMVIASNQDDPEEPNRCEVTFSLSQVKPAGCLSLPGSANIVCGCDV